MHGIVSMPISNLLLDLCSVLIDNYSKKKYTQFTVLERLLHLLSTDNTYSFYITFWVAKSSVTSSIFKLPFAKSETQISKYTYLLLTIQEMGQFKRNFCLTENKRSLSFPAMSLWRSWWTLILIRKV